ncbi:MAG: tRNA pseudouridine(55) synthase TruB [Clostridiales bacterium]
MNKKEYNCILNVLKPPGMTSFDVVGYLRKLTKIKKIGHTGTLDPMAVGVLTICIGKATKLLEVLVDKDKVYKVEMKLGESTDTQDAEGCIIEEKSIDKIDENTIIKVLESFVGIYNQIPPMYSAIKINGKRLYELARKGIEIERKSRKIEIRKIDLININKNIVKFDVECSKGTYIRTLCHDIGEKLGCGAHMNFLLRTRSGKFRIEDSYTLQEIEDHIKNNNFDKIKYSMEECFSDSYKIILNANEEKKFINGEFINYYLEMNSKELKKIPVFNNENKLIGLGKFTSKNSTVYLRPDKVI